MARYFFDIHDGDHFMPDDIGLELRDLEAAKAEAKKALPDIVKDDMSRTETGAISRSS